jgi:hypothetical protein
MMRLFEWLRAKRHKPTDGALRMADAMGISDIKATSRYQPYGAEAEPLAELPRRQQFSIESEAKGKRSRKPFSGDSAYSGLFILIAMREADYRRPIPMPSR